MANGREHRSGIHARGHPAREGLRGMPPNNTQCRIYVIHCTYTAREFRELRVNHV